MKMHLVKKLLQALTDQETKAGVRRADACRARQRTIGRVTFPTYPCDVYSLAKRDWTSSMGVDAPSIKALHRLTTMHTVGNSVAVNSRANEDFATVTDATVE